MSCLHDLSLHKNALFLALSPALAGWPGAALSELFGA